MAAWLWFCTAPPSGRMRITNQGATRATFVEDFEKADYTAVVVSLFRDPDDLRRICGWCLGPIELVGGRLVLPYVAPSRLTLGAVALLHAFGFALARGIGVCVVDPDGLWPLVRYA